MDRGQDIDATYSNGVLRPDEPLSLPENTRVRVTVHETNDNGEGPVRIKPDPKDAKRAREEWQKLASRGVLRLGGWRPTRDEMHERD